VSVNHRDVLITDIVTSNAAVHIVDRILDPRGHRHHDHECNNGLCQKEDAWEDWEDWLVEWAESA
jgi:hypothetical protein